MVVEDSQWILGSPMETSKTGSLSASTVTNMDTWQKSVEQREGNEKYDYALNVTRRGILQRIAKTIRQ